MVVNIIIIIIGSKLNGTAAPVYDKSRSIDASFQTTV
jgi:hypothetical protein